MDATGTSVLVHRYEGGAYRLRDIVDFFGLGIVEQDRPDERTRLVLSRAEARQLKAMADAYSFDHDEGFIALCLEVHRFAMQAPGAQVVFDADF